MLTHGQFLNQYYIERQLGQRPGRMTLLATDQNTQERRVIKLLNFAPPFDWQDYKLFQREATLLQTLQHSAIPQYVDCFDVDLPQCRGLALVQTYIEAPSLQEWMHSGRSFSEAEVMEIAAALLEVLGYLHGRCPPVIHRDIKPSNILVSDRSGHSVGPIYLVDFGAVQTVASGDTQTVVGSYGYMPLEQFGGRAVPASDLYGLGATLVELLTGTHPADWLNHQHQLQTLSVSPVLASWLQWLTQPQPQQRPASAQMALAALLAIPNTAATDSKIWIWQPGQQQWQPQIAVHRWHQPEDSQIVLERHVDHTAVKLPGDNWNKGCGLSVFMVITVAWNSVPLSAVGAMFSFDPSHLPNLSLADYLLAGTMMLFFVGVGLFLLYLTMHMLYRCLLLDHTRISFYPQRTDWTEHFRLGPCRWRHSYPKARLQKLVYIPSHFADDGHGGHARMNAQLELHLGLSKQVIQRNDLELQWLGQTLSQALDIPYECVDIKEKQTC